MKFQDKNYYEALEVPVNATLQEIHNAYIRAKNTYSEDSAALYSLMSPQECKAVLEQIEEAYSVIGVAEKKREYDKIRGLNQENTPEGYSKEIKNRPEYSPKKNLDLTEQTLHEKNPSAGQDNFTYESNRQSGKNEANTSKVYAFQKFGLDYENNSEFEQEIENCSHYTGDFLRKIREYKNVTIERMADMTKISKTYIRHIEDEDFSKLPANVYTRGFVYQYAKCLKLNPELVATSYMHHLGQLKSQTP